LLPEFWGQGYAIEGARAALQYGFNMLKLEEIVSVTVPMNLGLKFVVELKQ
jgi:RimJ/RimL family protein N-acetyltransferase